MILPNRLTMINELNYLNEVQPMRNEIIHKIIELSETWIEDIIKSTSCKLAHYNVSAFDDLKLYMT